VRETAARKAHDIRAQGFSGPAMLGIHDLEYVGISHRLDALDERFSIRGEAPSD
jgi:fructose 1,6-bisphosphatase